MKLNLFLAGLLFILVSCDQKQNAPAHTKQDIQSFMSDYRAAWKDGDSSLILQFISPDITMFRPSKSDTPIVGISDLSAFWFPESNMSYPILKYEVENEDINIGGDLAIYQGLSILEWCIEEKGIQRDTTLSISEFTTILRHEEDAWKIFRIMFNSKDKDYKG